MVRSTGGERTIKAVSVEPAANSEDSAKAEFPSGWKIDGILTATNIPGEVTDGNTYLYLFSNVTRTKLSTGRNFICTKVAYELSKDGKGIAEKIQSLEQEKAAINDKIINDAVNSMGMTEEAGIAAGKSMYEATAGMEDQIKALYALANTLSDEEYRRYVEAQGKLPEKEYVYSLTRDSKGVNIISYNGLGGKVIIPAELEGFPVTEVNLNGDKWGAHRKRISAVVIPDTVTLLPVFNGLTKLKEVTLPKGLTKIPDAMFIECIALTSFTIPDGVTEIGNGAFRESGLYSITIPDSVKKIGTGAFLKSGLQSIAIPDSITTIGDNMFWNCLNLTAVTIPDSVTGIGKEAFRYCYNLTNVTIPDSVKTIQDYAFSECSNLTEVTISPVKRRWDSSSFSKCQKLSLASQAAIRAAGYTGDF
jgi:hypothetical protein